MMVLYYGTENKKWVLKIYFTDDGRSLRLVLVLDGENRVATQRTFSDWANRKKFYDVIGKRARALSQLRTGFQAAIPASLRDHLALLRPLDLRNLLVGDVHITARKFLACCQFRGFTEATSTRADFGRVVTSLTMDQRRLLLLFITASDTFPAGHLRIVIRRTQQSTRLPQVGRRKSRLHIVQLELVSMIVIVFVFHVCGSRTRASESVSCPTTTMSTCCARNWFRPSTVELGSKWRDHACFVFMLDKIRLVQHGCPCVCVEELNLIWCGQPFVCPDTH
jgi:hypothetical protein